MGGALKHMMNRELSKGWRGWFAMYEEKMRKLQSMRESLRYFMNRELAKGWNGWFALYQDAVRARASMGGAIKHMLNRGLSKGWNGWYEQCIRRPWPRRLRWAAPFAT